MGKAKCTFIVRDKVHIFLKGYDQRKVSGLEVAQQKQFGAKAYRIMWQGSWRGSESHSSRREPGAKGKDGILHVTSWMTAENTDSRAEHQTR